MSRAHRTFTIRRAITVGTFCAYLIAACLADLFHTEECPLTTGKTESSSETCPACKFLAGANSTEVLYESAPLVMEFRMVLPTAPVASAVVTAWPSAILRRGPPCLLLG